MATHNLKVPKTETPYGQCSNLESQSKDPSQQTQTVTEMPALSNSMLHGWMDGWIIYFKSVVDLDTYQC